MEAMLGQAMRTPNHLQSLIAEFNVLLEKHKKPQTRDDIKKAMKLEGEPERFKEAETRCSLEHLQLIDDIRVTPYIPGFTELSRRTVCQIPHDALKLNTFSKLLKEKENSINNPFERTRDSFKAVHVPTSPNNIKLYNHKYYDLLIYVRVYRPARATHIGQRLEKPVFAEEFQCLGSNLLTEFRDKISCVCNKKRFFDISENPYDVNDGTDKETDPGFFFITDTFYNDTRNPANPDYSETIREWAKRAKGLMHLQFKVAQMEKTRFSELTVSLGFPQLYQHHGNCEHVFVFSQVEVITPNNTSSLVSPKEYPLLLSFSSFNNRMCNMCGKRTYVFVVEGSDRQLHDPAYLCSKCFFGFHYIDGKKVGQFKAYKVNTYDEDLPDEESGGTDLVEVSQLEDDPQIAPLEKADCHSSGGLDNSSGAGELVESIEIVKSELDDT